jgi:AraC-like DNA-binding protein
VVGIVARGADVPAELLDLSRANLDQICVTDHEDHPERYRVAFKAAACSTVADVLRRSCRRPVPVFASQNFIHVVASIAEIRTRRAFAKTLGVTETRLQGDLRAAGLLWRTVCARLRALAASRLLGDTDQPLKRIAHLVGYRSMVALEKGFRVQLGITASEIRSGGGLWAIGALIERQPKAASDAGVS